MKYTKLILVALFVVVTFTANAQTETPAINHTQKKERKRIKQGVASGELNKAEARRLRKEQRRIARMEQHAKADGTVTKAERRRIKKEQRAASRHIVREKHD